MFGVLINVGSSSSDPNGRGRIFKDGRFEYIPIPERERTAGKVPTYRDLGFAHVDFPDMPVHLDPEFDDCTYGHVRRGFGDIQNLQKLGKNDLLFFYATLQNGDRWSPFIIGYFPSPRVYDCRRLLRGEIAKFRAMGFEKNAHLKRVDPTVDILVKGGKGSKLLSKAFPLSENEDPLTPRQSIKNLIMTASSRNIKPGSPWFRWTLICNNAERLLKMVDRGSCL